MLNYTLYINSPTKGLFPFADFKWIEDAKIYFQHCNLLSLPLIYVSFDNGKTFILAEKFFSQLEG